LRRPVALNVPGMVLLGCLWLAPEALGDDFGGETQPMFPLRGPAILQMPVESSFAPAVSGFGEVPIWPTSGTLLVRGQSPDEIDTPEQYAPAAEPRRLLPFSLFDKPPQSSQETPVARPDSMSAYLKGRGSVYLAFGAQQFDFVCQPGNLSDIKYSGNSWLRTEFGAGYCVADNWECDLGLGIGGIDDVYSSWNNPVAQGWAAEVDVKVQVKRFFPNTTRIVPYLGLQAGGLVGNGSIESGFLYGGGLAGLEFQLRNRSARFFLEAGFVESTFGIQDPDVWQWSQFTLMMGLRVRDRWKYEKK
jgi:hypothetical protein